MKPLFIYNLFPGLYKNTQEWVKCLDDIINMGFNSIFINPFHQAGFSGSLYSVKDYYEYNNLFFTSGTPAEAQLKQFIDVCKAKNIDVFMDLVINHSAIDSVLIEEHKNWYKLDDEGEIERPGAWEDGKWITWGDLATFDFDNSADKNGLWEYLLNICYHYLDMGFSGFRCDAAYQVSSDFWDYLISHVKQKYNDVLFLAETLGCTPVQIQLLSTCGFDYIFNSSKWWDFNEPWCLEQYDLSRKIAPSISFPESHDTERLMNEVDSDQVKFTQRLYFSALFSKGFMIPTGFEYGFTKRISTVDTRPEDWEETGITFSDKIKMILSIKKELRPLHEESRIEIVDHENWMNVFCFIKEWENEKVLICINKDIENNQNIEINYLEDILQVKQIIDYSPEERIKGNLTKLSVDLLPGEIKILAQKKK